MKTVDARNLSLLKKHPLIFGSINQLQPGDSVLIINNHDPKPLKVKLAADRSASYEFEYLQEGPVDWKVKITRIK